LGASDIGKPRLRYSRVVHAVESLEAGRAATRINTLILGRDITGASAFD
jgi:hypothetical protein